MVIWLIGLSGAGKTEVGKKLYDKLKPDNPNLLFLDGDILRQVWGGELDHTLEGRRKNSDRICALCTWLDSQDIHVLCSVLSIFPEAQAWNRQHYSDYFEIFLKVSMEELVRRDPKGLYRNARAGVIQNVVGVDIPFPTPLNPDLVIENEGLITADIAVLKILEKLSKTAVLGRMADAF